MIICLDSHNSDLYLLLGAGASKPLGIPTSDDMVQEFLKTELAEPLSPFADTLVKEDHSSTLTLDIMLSLMKFGLIRIVMLYAAVGRPPQGSLQ